MWRRSSVLAIGTALATTSYKPMAWADQVEGTRNPVAERAHRATLSFYRGFVELTVRRTVHNPGPRHDQAQFSIDMPRGAVATGLATLGTLRGRPHWFHGDLLEAEQAAERYRELTGIGGYYPKDPALLSWRSAELLKLQVFPVAPGVPKTIQYRMLLPTEYRAGRYRYVFHAVGTEELPARIQANPALAADRLAFGDEPAIASNRVAFVANAERELSLIPAATTAVASELATIGLGSGRAITRFSIDLAPKLSELPRRAKIVILIDGSYSLSAEDRRAEVRAAGAFLSHFADAGVAIASFDRAVNAMGGFRSVASAQTALESLDITGRNGSNVDAALAYADALLAATPKGSERRILLLTDSLVRRDLTPALLGDRFGRSRALLHIGVVNGWGDAAIIRDDEHAWAPIARASGGLVWQAALGPEADPVAVQKEAERWARPTSLDRISLLGAGLENSTQTKFDTLPEGESLSDLFLSDRATQEITLRGELWSQTFEVIFEANAPAARRWAALVFGSPLLHSLNEREMMELARLGGAVSPVTSYLAIEPGVRPSTEGLDYARGEGGLGLSGIGEGGGGRSHGLALSDFDHQAYLAKLLKTHAERCALGARRLRIDLELTRQELVAIGDLTVNQGADVKIDAASERCLREALWNEQLPSRFEMPHSEWVVQI